MHQILAGIFAILVLLQILFFLYHFMGKFFEFGNTYFYITFYDKFKPKQIAKYSILIDLVLLGACFLI